MISKQIGKPFKKGGKNDRKRGKKEEIYEKMRGKKEKGNKKDIRI